jgi:hypothetical protein
MPVRYQSELPTIGITQRHRIPLAALIKGEAWRYESEWRLVEAAMGSKWKGVAPQAVGGIVLGAKISEENESFVTDLIAQRADAGHPPMHLYRARIDPRKFELDFFKLRDVGWMPEDLP